MEKIRYETDPHNRLIADSSGNKSGLPVFRKVLDGEFRTGKDSALSYHIKSPLAEPEGIPNQLNLKGRWSLTDNYDLRLTVDKEFRETFGDKITLQGEILDVDGGRLLFAVTTKTKEGRRSTYCLDLEGSWKVDESNRLSFHVKKEAGAYDILTFNGVWEINKDHEIIYRYERAHLVQKKRLAHTITFKGYWDIKNALRISYVLSGGTDSIFDFSASAGMLKQKYVRYEVGIILAGRKSPVRRILTLYGKWNLKKDAGLIFEIEYADGRVHAITFGAEARLTGRDTVSFSLKDDMENKDIGMTLKLSRRLLKGDGEVFLRALHTGGEAAVYAGGAWRW